MDDRDDAAVKPSPKFTVAEVCAALGGIDERTLRRRLKEAPWIKPLRPGRALLFTLADIEALEEACRSRSSRPAAGSNIAPAEPIETGSVSSAAPSPAARERAPRSRNSSPAASARARRRRETKALLRSAWQVKP